MEISNLNTITGKWYVVMSTFPMWLKGDKTTPTFNYKLLGKGKLSDVVTYCKGRKVKRIEGIDTFSGDKFIWRGKGLLRIAKSQWEFLWMSEKQDVALIRFEKTLFTPAGYDVICRGKKLTTAQTEAVNRILQQRGIENKVKSLTKLK